MAKVIHFSFYFLIISIVLFGTSCDSHTGVNPDFLETVEPVEEVHLVAGGENAAITVSKSGVFYYMIEFSDIAPNDLITNGTREGWCIDWLKPIDTSGSTYRGIKLYSTYLVEKWKPVNYLLNIKDELKENDPDLTSREIQAAIWSLRANPAFDLDEIAVEDLPGRMRTDGQPNFSYEKVEVVLKRVNRNYKDFDYSAAGSKFAIIAETPADVQTVITVVEKQ